MRGDTGSQPGTGSHWALWDARRSSSCCRGRPDPGSAGSCGSPRPWEVMLTGFSPRVGSRHGCSPVGASTGIGESPSLRNASAAGGEQHSRCQRETAGLLPFCSPGCIPAWSTRGELPTPHQEHPGAGARPAGTGAGRPQSCFALPQRPRKEVVAFLGEEKGSRAASAGQAQLQPLAAGSVRVDCPESMNEPRRARIEPSPAR